MNKSGHAHRRHIGLVCCIMFVDLSEVKCHQAHDFLVFMATQTFKLQAKTNLVVLVSSSACPIVWRTWVSYPVIYPTPCGDSSEELGAETAFQHYSLTERSWKSKPPEVLAKPQ